MRIHHLPYRTTTLLLTIGAFVTLTAWAGTGLYRQSPHGSPVNGVQRLADKPRGSCLQCHSTHDAGMARPFGLFMEDSNELCMSQSAGGCHADQPSGATTGYPATEANRLPLGSDDPGYFEHNSAGVRIPGTNNLVRWPGRVVYQNAIYSSHYIDTDMPVKDAFGYGSCDNCHDVHGGPSARDMLDTTYSGIVGSQLGAKPANYELCLQCHSIAGPMGMRESSKYISDYYDRTINPREQSGHGISHGSGYVPTGARLPCADCHNPHGSQGNGNSGPNAFLLSDERSGWYGLTDIRNDNSQVRRFCFGCHTSSDGQGGGQIEGMTLEQLPGEVAEHQFDGTVHCYDCHGRDYSSPTSFNVHNPSDGESGESQFMPPSGKIGRGRR